MKLQCVCRLLAVLHQQYSQPCMLRSVQRKLPSNLLAHPDLSLGRVSTPICSCRSSSLHDCYLQYGRSSTWPASTFACMTHHRQCSCQLVLCPYDKLEDLVQNVHLNARKDAVFYFYKEFLPSIFECNVPLPSFSGMMSTNIID